MHSIASDGVLVAGRSSLKVRYIIRSTECATRTVCSSSTQPSSVVVHAVRPESGRLGVTHSLQPSDEDGPSVAQYCHIIPFATGIKIRSGEATQLVTVFDNPVSQHQRVCVG